MRPELWTPIFDVDTELLGAAGANTLDHSSVPSVPNDIVNMRGTKNPGETSSNVVPAT